MNIVGTTYMNAPFTPWGMHACT